MSKRSRDRARVLPFPADDRPREFDSARERLLEHAATSAQTTHTRAHASAPDACACNISRAFLLGGRARFGVYAPEQAPYNGRSYHFKIVRPRYSRPSRSDIESAVRNLDSLLVLVRAGKNSITGEHKWQYLGTMSRALIFRITAKSVYTISSACVRAFAWALDVVRDQAQSQISDGWSIRHNGRCGRCGRVLTDASSIARGIGPVCARW